MLILAIYLSFPITTNKIFDLFPFILFFIDKTIINKTDSNRNTCVIAIP